MSRTPAYMNVISGSETAIQIEGYRITYLDPSGWNICLEKLDGIFIDDPHDWNQYHSGKISKPHETNKGTNASQMLGGYLSCREDIRRVCLRGTAQVHILVAKQALLEEVLLDATTKIDCFARSRQAAHSP